MEHYRQALQLNPRNAEAHNNMGNALLKQGRLEEAMQHYRQALQIDPNFPEPQQALNRALTRQGKQ